MWAPIYCVKERQRFLCPPSNPTTTYKCTMLSPKWLSTWCRRWLERYWENRDTMMKKSLKYILMDLQCLNQIAYIISNTKEVITSVWTLVESLHWYFISFHPYFSQALAPWYLLHIHLIFVPSISNMLFKSCPHITLPRPPKRHLPPSERPLRCFWGYVTTRFAAAFNHSEIIRHSHCPLIWITSASPATSLDVCQPSGNMNSKW